MTVVTVGVSAEVIERLGWEEMPVVDRVRKALRTAIRMGLPPELHVPEPDVSVVAKIALSGNDEHRLKALPVERKAAYTLDRLAAGCVNAFSREQIPNTDLENGEGWIDGARREQPVMCRLMAESAENQDILFLEASTGVGKGRALAAHAAHLAATDRAKRVVIAAPTLEVLGQLYSEYKMLKPGASEPASMIGLGEFVSEVALKELLQGPASGDLPDADMASRWLQDTATKPWGKLGKRWLCDSLAEAAPDFPTSLVALNHYQKAVISEEEDRGLRAYLQCSRQAKHARVVFCTHILLALDVVQRLYASREDGIPFRERKNFQSSGDWWHADLEKRALSGRQGLIPNYDAVLIDEAHLLEQSFARATSDQISIFALKNLLMQHGNPALQTIAKRTFKTLTQLGSTEKMVRVGDGDVRSEADRIATKCVASLVRSIRRNEKAVKSKAARSALQDFRRKLGWLAAPENRRLPFSTTMFFTPSRRYPLIEKCKYDVNVELTFLWKLVKHGVLASATLYLQTAGGYAVHDMRKELRVPPSRARAMRPIRPSWVTDPVTVHLPGTVPRHDSASEFLVVPKQDADDAAWSAYYDRIAKFVEDNWQSRTGGGTLILMTSFAAIEEVGSRLMQSVLQERLLVSERKESFSDRRKEYLKAVERGAAPIWLATGRAWTGLDLRTGRRASDDHAIDYLVIPRLPVLINCSASHRERVFSGEARGSFGYREVWQCARFLKQGVGRVVRRRGVPEKEVFVLDGRLSWSVGGPFCSLRGMFADYQRQEIICMDQ